MGSIVGLDISDEFIKVFEFLPGENRISCATIRLSVGDTASSCKRVIEIFEKLKLCRDNIVVNLRGSYILARSYQPPLSNKADFEDWFVNNIESLIPSTPIDDVVYSYQRFKSGRVLIAFARLQQVRRQLDFLKSCNIAPQMIDASALALYNVFKEHPWTKQRSDFGILNLGYKRSELLLITGGEPYGVNEIDFGVGYYKKAELKNFVLSLQSVLLRVLSYYKRSAGLEIKKIIMTGDYKRVPGLKKNLKEIMDMDIQTPNPFRLKKISSSAGLKHNPSYTLAYGLALKGLDSEGINLIPYEEQQAQKRLKYRTRMKQLAKKSLIYAGISAFVLLAIILFFIKNNQKFSKLIEKLELRRSTFNTVINENRVISEKLSKLQELSRKRVFWSEFLYHLGSNLPAGLYFTELKSDFRLVSQGKEVVRKTTVQVKGKAKDYKAVLNFIKVLEKEYHNIVIESIKGEGECTFTINLEI
ncbi:hypothetical protein BXT86_01270 [candidate division WOR-3 bacterium 4484_100]|uniref:SHS2 domain-containing protein n=1 Tax=candidate division WOR-3 bacterium 4484_100 TaxID=1936077 RepID=A0A1V4QHS7_UNCW3|nr:MAG: hypothetical protein BXT86_01270 [candidate division WOR-3 bacterium 4484_100]